MSSPSDALRTRIAAVLYDRWWHCSMSLREPPRWGKLSDSARESWLADADAVIRELDSHGWLIDPESGERHQNRVNDVLKTSNHHCACGGCQ